MQAIKHNFATNISPGLIQCIYRISLLLTQVIIRSKHKTYCSTVDTFFDNMIQTYKIAYCIHERQSSECRNKFC